MKFKGCRNCFKTKGYIYEKDQNEEIIAKKCKCLIDFQNSEILKIKLKESNLSSDFLDFNISSYKGRDNNKNLEIIDYYISNFSNLLDHNFYFYGVQGTQKTTLAKYIILEMLKKEYNGYYILADNLIKLLIDNRNEDSLKQIEIIKNKDLLVLDEISDDKCTIFQSDYQIPFLTSFLKERLEQIKKSTIFISNYEIDILYKSKFGKTIADLINRECKDKLKFEDVYFELNKNDIKSISKMILGND